MRSTVPPGHRRPLLAGALMVTAGLALAPPAGADVLLTDYNAGDAIVGPVLVAPDGSRRPLAGGAADPSLPEPVVSPDRRFVVAGVAGSEKPVLLPTDGSASIPLADAFAGPASGGSAFWWTSPTTVVSATVGLGVRGSIDTCTAPAGTCKGSRAPGTERIGTFDTGASLWLDQPFYALPEGLNGAIGSWKTATAAQIRRTRTALRRRVPTRVILRGPDGRTKVLSTSRRSSGAGTDVYEGFGDGGSQVLFRKSRTQTTLRTRRRGSRTQVRIDSGTSELATGIFSTTGRRRSVRFRAPAGVHSPTLDAVTAVPGGWLTTVYADGPGTTQLIARLGTGGSVDPLRLGGKPLTARTLSAAIGLPIPATEKPDDGEQAFALRPIGYEAATDSDVVAYDEPDAEREVVARVPRNGSSPSLVQRGERNLQYSTIAW